MDGINNINIALEPIPIHGPSTILGQIAYLSRELIEWRGDQQRVNTVATRLDLGEVAIPFYVLINNSAGNNFGIIVDSSPTFDKFPQIVPPDRTIFLMPETSGIYAAALGGPVYIWVQAVQIVPTPPPHLVTLLPAALSLSGSLSGVIPVPVSLPAGDLSFQGGLSSELNIERLINGSFETGDFTGWVISGIIPPPDVNTTGPAPVDGTFDCLLGNITDPGPPSPGGSSWIYQEFVVSVGRDLTFWHWNYSEENEIAFDQQYVYLSDTSNNVLHQFFYECSDGEHWVKETLNLTPWIGQTVRINFQVNQSDEFYATGMFIDEVSYK